jgi:hypothetical protein
MYKTKPVPNSFPLPLKNALSLAGSTLPLSYLGSRISTKSNLHFDSSFETVTNEPSIYKILTFLLKLHLKNAISYWLIQDYYFSQSRTDQLVLVLTHICIPKWVTQGTNNGWNCVYLLVSFLIAQKRRYMRWIVALIGNSYAQDKHNLKYANHGTRDQTCL